LSPIEWKLSFVRGDPGDAVRRAAARTRSDGMVVAQATGSADLRFSVVVKTGGMSELALCLAGAFSASEGIRKDTGIITWVRWPERVVTDGAVVARSSAVFLPEKGYPRAIMGFSVNRLRRPGRGSTSLEDELGVRVDERLLLAKILESLSWMHFGWTNGMQDHVFSRVRSMTETIGRVVSVRKAAEVRRGTATGIDALGRLLVKFEDGRTVGVGRADELISE